MGIKIEQRLTRKATDSSIFTYSIHLGILSYKIIIETNREVCSEFAVILIVSKI